MHLHHDIPYTCETYAREVLAIREDDVTLSTTKLYHAYGLGNNLTFPYWVGASTVLMTRPSGPGADPRHGRRAAAQPVLQRADALRRDGQPARRDRARPELGADVRLRRRAARARGAAALAGGVRPGHRRRHRLDRDAAHLLLQPARARPSGHERHARARLRAGPARRASAARSRPARSATSTSAATAPLAALLAPARQDARPRCTATAFFTGDRYRQIEDGCFVYEGRADDMIKVGGLWASPIEIENVLVEHPRCSRRRRSASTPTTRRA